MERFKRLLRRGGRVVIAAVAVLLVIVIIRAASVRPIPFEVTPGEELTVDADAVADKLAGALRLETVTRPDAPPAREPLLALHDHLERSFPRVHATLTREVVADYSLLYTWRGSDPAARPIAILAHLDVVPVDPNELAEWEQPPFSGAVAGGFVWGRGAVDNKNSVISILQAVEQLLESGAQPRRTIYLAFGHDEEGDGGGARAIVERLRSRDVRLEFTLDEGMLILERQMPIAAPVALVGVAEKGYLSVRLRVRSESGHSSIPARAGSITTLADAIQQLRDHPLPADLRPPTGLLFDALAPEMSFGMRAVFANRWLFDPLILRLLASRPATDAMIRTTTAFTMIDGGVKDNVLPGVASVVINHRILPGETIEDVLAHVRRVVPDPAIELEPLPGGRDPTRVSAADGPGFLAVRRALARTYPEVVTVPGLVIGGTDSRFYEEIADDSYRFSPLRFEPEDNHRFHGLNERIPIEDLAGGVRFYAQFILAADRGD